MKSFRQDTFVGYMHALMSIQMNYCIFFSILCFIFTLLIVLIHSHESPLSLYFILFYFPLFVSLFMTWHFSFASTCCGSLCVCFCQMWDYKCLHMPQLPCICFCQTQDYKILSCAFGKSQILATYDPIGKSWARTRYMCSELRNTLSLSSVLDYH